MYMRTLILKVLLNINSKSITITPFNILDVLKKHIN